MAVFSVVGDVIDAAVKLLRPGHETPHEKKAEQVRDYLAKHWLRIRPRTRAILIFAGAVLIVVAWLTPWYDSLTWSMPGSQSPGTSSAGYEVTSLSPGDPYAKYGLGAWSKTLTGHDLSSGPAVLRSIAFSSADFYSWVALALLALITIRLLELPGQGRLTAKASRRVYRAIKSGEVVVLLFVVARSLWKGFDLASRATVDAHAQQALFGGPAPAAAHYVTNYSFGLTILPIGLILAAIGVLSADKQEKVMIGPDGAPVSAARKIRVKAWALALIAIIFVAITYGLFDG